MITVKPLSHWKRKKKINLSTAIIAILATIMISIISVLIIKIYDQSVYEKKMQDFIKGEFGIYKTHYKDLTFDVFVETKKAAKKNNLPVQEILAYFHNESNFKRTAVSCTGAQGIGQLMPDTARWLGVADSFDIKQNIPASVKFYKYCKNRANGNIRLAYMKYNGGPNRKVFPAGGESIVYSGRCIADLNATTRILIARL
jgi:soluble lytic murein transglycosylase-like protein